MTTSGIKEMLQYANKLSLLELTYINSIVIDFADYQAILKTVQNRNEKVQLKIRSCDPADVFNIPENILAENRYDGYRKVQAIFMK